MARPKHSRVMPREENGAKKAKHCAESSKSAGKEEDGAELSEKALSDRIVVPPSDPQVEKEEDDIVVLDSKPGELVCLSSENESTKVGSGHGLDDGQVDSSAKPPRVTNVATGWNKRSYSTLHARSFDCTACGKEMFSVEEIHVHPKLVGVGICSDCYDFLFSSPFTKDKIDYAENQCLWCGQGGEVVMCDKCDKVFCKSCIVRNFGRKKLAQILDESNWSCFYCNPELLSDRVEELREFRKSVPSETNVSVRRQGAGALAGKSRTREPSDRIVGTFGEGPTIAELLARNEEKRKQKEGVCTSPRNTSRVKSRTQKARASRKEAGTSKREFPTGGGEIRHPIEVKQHEGIEKQAPSATAARTWIRPHQWIEKRQEAAERRKRIKVVEAKPPAQSDPLHASKCSPPRSGHCRETASPIADTHGKSVDISDAQVAHEIKVKKSDPERVFDRSPRSNLFAKFAGAKSVMTT